MRTLHRVVAAVLVSAGIAFGVTTSHWTQTNEADFKKGTLHNVVVTNLGDLKLSRDVKMQLEQDPRVSAVYCLTEGPDGSIYAGTGPSGVVLRVKDGNVTTVGVVDDNANIESLCVDAQGRLLAASASEHGRIVRFDHPDKPDQKAAEIFSADGVQYVWAMTQTPDGKLYAATGPAAQLFEINPDGSKSVIFKSDESNLLSLLSDGKDMLYVGSDPNGILYRVNRKTKDVFVLFNAPESEISCLAMDAKGNLYAGTAEASDDQDTGAADEGAQDKVGRPEGTNGMPIPAPAPDNPKPPAVPDPNPGEPNPIPKKTAALLRRAVHEHPLMLMDDPDNPEPPKEPTPPVPGAKNKEAATEPAKPAIPHAEENARPKAQGNAVYKIDTEGFVHEIFRQNVMVLSMIEHDGILLVGTGSDGLVYQINPQAEETLVLAKVEPKDVLSLLAARDGRVFLGMGNVGGIAAMSAGYATQGTYTSSVLDATQVSRFGKISLEGSLPPDTNLTVSTRSGNVQDPSKVGWAGWSAEIPAAQFAQIPSPSARFLQYRLTFTSKESKDSPVIRRVDLSYQMPNLAPVVHTVKVVAVPKPPDPGPGDPPVPPISQPNRLLVVAWEADDPNGDALRFSVYYRSAGQQTWTLLADKLADPHYEWDTGHVADGHYEVKVVASDALANEQGAGLTGSRISDPLVVDNTPPVIGDVATHANGASVQIEARLVDQTTFVASCEYAVDSSADWQTVLPTDNIFDGPEETVRFTVSGLTAGQHRVTLRATDAKGNQAFRTLMVTIESPAH